MNDEIANLMTQFGQMHPDGFNPELLIRWLVKEGISLKDAIEAVNFQKESMEELG